MTDAERIELEALELRCKAHALAERELDRLYYLRLRAAGVCTWREVTDAIQAQIGPEAMPSIQAQVRKDLEAREKLGVERYGTALYPRNGRDALRDAYEEALDLCCYLKQAMVERDGEAE